MFYVVDTEGTCKVLDADGAEVTDPTSVDPGGVPEGGGVIATTEHIVQVCVTDPGGGGGSHLGSTETAHLAHIVKREPVENVDSNKQQQNQQQQQQQQQEEQQQQSRVVKAGRGFDMDPLLIPIKAIPALNVVTASSSSQQQQHKASADAIPYIPPDTTLLYQPEEGVLKSRPVPRPTRGRRGRRRGSVGLVPLTARHCGPGGAAHHPADVRTHREPRRLHRHPYQRYNLPESAAPPPQYCSVEGGTSGGEFEVIHPDAAGDMMGGGYGELGSLTSISPRYPQNSRWYCSEDYLKMPNQWYGEYEGVVLSWSRHTTSLQFGSVDFLSS